MTPSEKGMQSARGSESGAVRECREWGLCRGILGKQVQIRDAAARRRCPPSCGMRSSPRRSLLHDLHVTLIPARCSENKKLLSLPHPQTPSLRGRNEENVQSRRIVRPPALGSGLEQV